MAPGVCTTKHITEVINITLLKYSASFTSEGDVKKLFRAVIYRFL